MIDLAALFRVPVDKPTVREFCRRITLPDGPHAGMTYEPDVEAPQQVAVSVMDGEILDYNGEPFRDIALAWCTQAGKSLSSVLVPALHSTIGCGDPVVYCLPTADLLGKVWTTKLKPSIEGAGFSGWIPDRGPGSMGGRPNALPFIDPSTGRKAGQLIFVAGGQGKKREAGQAGVTAAVVLIDEADEYEDAHRIGLIQQRAASYGKHALFIKASTVKKDESSIILHLWEESTASRIWYACPHCGRHQSLEWSQVKYEGDDDASVSESARYACKNCGALWDERDRRKALCDWRLVHRGQEVDESGVVVGAIPRVKSFGLLCGKLDFGIGLGLQELAVEHFRAKRLLDVRGDHGLMRSFFRDRLSRGYENEEIGERVTAKALAQRAERSHVHKREVPRWAEFITVAMDVQKDRCYWQAMCHGDGRWAIFDYGYEPFSERGTVATTEQKHAAFNAISESCMEGWQIKGGAGIMVPSRMGIDSGYDEDTVSKWAATSGWELLKGAARNQMRQMGTKQVTGKMKTVITVPGWCEVRRQDRGQRIWFIDSDNSKRQVQNGLMMLEDAPGKGYVPQGEPSNGYLLLHLSAEVWDRDEEKGKWYWRQVRRRNDMLDCAAYNLAMGKVHEENLRRKESAPKRRFGALGETS